MNLIKSILLFIITILLFLTGWIFADQMVGNIEIDNCSDFLYEIFNKIHYIFSTL